RPSNRVFIMIQRMRATRKPSAVRIVVRPVHRTQFLFDVQFFARLKQQHLQPVGRQNVGCHSSSCARSDNHRIIFLAKVCFRLSHRKTRFLHSTATQRHSTTNLRVCPVQPQSSCVQISLDI